MVVGALGVGLDALLIDPRDVFRDLYPKRVKTLRGVLDTLGLNAEIALEV